MGHILKYHLEHFILSPFLENYPERISERISKHVMEHYFLQNTFRHPFCNTQWNTFQNTLWNAKKTHCGTLKKHIAERSTDHIWNGKRRSKLGTLPSTDRVRCCLTSVIGREPVLSRWYGHWQSGKKAVVYIKLKLINCLKF